MSTTELGTFPKPNHLFEKLKDAFQISHVGMTPGDELPSIEVFNDVRDLELVHPWHLTDVAPTQKREHPVAFGIAKFVTDKLVIRDRASHWIPHVPGPETEHAYLNLVRATAKDIGVVAPVEKGVYRHHLCTVPINEPVLVELHNMKRGELTGEQRVKAFGVALGFLRNLETGEPFAEAMLQWSDKA